MLAFTGLWMAGSSPEMTIEGSPNWLFLLVAVEQRLDLLWVDIEGRDLGALYLQEPADPAVALAPAAVHRLGQLFESQVRKPHRHPDLTPEPDRERDVLVEEA